jgi:hypothetical protein
VAKKPQKKGNTCVLPGGLSGGLSGDYRGIIDNPIIILYNQIVKSTRFARGLPEFFFVDIAPDNPGRLCSIISRLMPLFKN